MLSFHEEILVRGRTASIGMHPSVSGRVTVVTKPEDIKKLRKGDMVVSLDIGSARADFDQKFSGRVYEVIRRILEDASALILEKGSVAYPICFSARQQRLPVIVQADGATKVLKEGMDITIDIRTGEVRKSYISWITDSLALGGSRVSPQYLKQNDIAVVIDLNNNQGEKIQMEKFRLEYHGTYVEDGTTPELTQLKTIVNWIKKAINQGKKVFIHCTEGYGRSPTCVAAYLIHTCLNYEQAVALIKHKRKGAWGVTESKKATQDQMNILKKFESTKHLSLLGRPT